jgi:hypothetical protein
MRLARPRGMRDVGRMKRFNAVLLVALLPLFGCDGDDGTTVGEANVLIRFLPGPGSFSAKVNGKTYSQAGRFALDLPDLGKTYDVTGTFTGSLTMDFATTTAAGVMAGSVVNVEGPVVIVTPCGLSYVTTASGTQQFRFQIKTTGSIGAVCL